MPIRLRAARASAMMRVLPYSNSLIVIGLRLLNGDVGGAFARLREDLELRSGARVFANQQRIAREGAVQVLTDQRCPRSECSVGRYGDQQARQQCQRLQWCDSRVTTRAGYCAHLDPIRIATDVSPRRSGLVFRVTVLSGGFLTPMVLRLRRADISPPGYPRPGSAA